MSDDSAENNAAVEGSSDQLAEERADIAREIPERIIRVEDLGLTRDDAQFMSLDRIDAIEREKNERSGYSYYNGGSPLEFPRMNMLVADRAKFLEGLNRYIIEIKGRSSEYLKASQTADKKLSESNESPTEDGARHRRRKT